MNVEFLHNIFNTKFCQHLKLLFPLILANCESKKCSVAPKLVLHYWFKYYFSKLLR